MSGAAKACVIGWPIVHSRSPSIHRYWLKRYDIDGTYDRVAVRPNELAGVIETLRGDGYRGLNVTVPHKEAVLDLVNEADEVAHAIGAANTLWFEDGLLLATNTDAYGFIANLSAEAPGWRNLGAPVVVLGAGGAARAVVKGLISEGVREIRLMNRTRERAQLLARHFGAMISVHSWRARDRAIAGSGLLVNTTSLGMMGARPLDIEIGELVANAIVADIVYAPLETGLLRQAQAMGFRTVDGLGMLLHQAIPGFEKWFGVRPEVTPELRDHIIADLEREPC